jgi:hypothetical protein
MCAAMIHGRTRKCVEATLECRADIQLSESLKTTKLPGNVEVI